jgi:hypothetical protein
MSHNKPINYFQEINEIQLLRMSEGLSSRKRKTPLSSSSIVPSEVAHIPKKRKQGYTEETMKIVLQAILQADEMVKIDPTLKEVNLSKISEHLQQIHIDIPYRTLSRRVEQARKELSTTGKVKERKLGRPQVLNEAEYELLKTRLQQEKANQSGKLTRQMIGKIAKEVAGLRRPGERSDKEGKKRANRVGGTRWIRTYLRQRRGKKVRNSRASPYRRLLKTNPETALNDLRNKAEWFCLIEIREEVLKGEPVLGKNSLGVEKRFWVGNNGEIVSWGGIYDKDPWPVLLEDHDGVLYNKILNRPLHGPSDKSRLGCLDETPFHLFLTGLYTIIFQDIGEEAASHALQEESAWTILLLSLANGSLGPSLLIVESKAQKAKGIDLEKAQGNAPPELYVTHTEEGQINVATFMQYMKEIVQDFQPDHRNPLYIQLDGHSSRSTWKNARQ